MRWESLFQDLEGQADALAIADRAAEVEERTRAELSRLRLLDRVRPAVGTAVRVRCTGGCAVAGRLSQVAPEWLLVDEGGGREVLIALGRVLAVHGLGRLATVPGSESVIESRLGFAHALRGVARDRSVVRIQLTDGENLDGTIDRVGSDFFELAVHPAGESRRRDAVREVTLVATSGVVAIRRGV